jgi:hypothetical protein
MRENMTRTGMDVLPRSAKPTEEFEAPAFPLIRRPKDTFHKAKLKKEHEQRRRAVERAERGR